MANLPRTEFAIALAQVAAERGLDPDVILTSLKTAMIAAYRRDARERGLSLNEDEELEAEIDQLTGETRIFKISHGQKTDITPVGFGRIAAQTAKQVILQKIHEEEKSAVLAEYSTKIGTLVSGMILRFDGPNIIVDIGKAEAIMPPAEQVRAEGYKLNQRLTFLIAGIKEGPRGQQIVVSRAAGDLVKALFKREVPEIASGAVEIVLVAREAGGRTKIAVSSKQAGVDPVGSCVGQKGVRVQEVIEELNGEKIDIIQFDKDLEKFIAAALSPAQGIKVEIDEKGKTAKVTVPEDQLSLAIGKEGQNVRLAAKLTGVKIDIVGSQESALPSESPKEEKKKKTKSIKEKTVQEKNKTSKKAKVKED
jgi:N utilization substance protein A